MGNEPPSTARASPEQDLFARALECASFEERAAFVESACPGDLGIQRRLDELLRAAELAGDFLEVPPEGVRSPAGPSSASEGFEPRSGLRIGRYKLLEKIGEGGCGDVYRCEQEEPVRRHVALKILKRGMDTRSVVARFEAERQALALMEHPSIARVFDGGVAATGRPYFVMELVRGLPITRFCDEARLSTEARLDLFVQVCHAIQHAHQKGIVHRDLKPSNILVTLNDGIPVPKVIDFGIAKAIGQPLTDKTLFTRFHAFIGTPAYISPEQAEMTSVDIDTRSDIYSLGVLLYELLTGRTPFDGEALLRSGLDAMRRTIRDELPVRPSTRLTAETRGRVLKWGTVRAAPSEGGGGFPLPGGVQVHKIRGDLDWIVMKCLEKDRARRYATANGLAADVQRHLNHEPIVARPPGCLYRLGKLARRHRAACAAAAVIAVSAVAAVVVSVSEAFRAQRGESRALAALADLRATAPVFAAQAGELAARGQFAEALEKLDYAIKLRPDRVEYLGSKADILESRLLFAAAAEVYAAVLRLAPGDPHASRHRALCENLLAAGIPNSGLWDDRWEELFIAMTEENRSQAEMKNVADLALEYSRHRLASVDALASSLDERLTVEPGKLIGLDLEGSGISDLTALEGLPLGFLNLQGCPVDRLDSLRRLPLRQLNLIGLRVSDLAPLGGVRSLVSLTIKLSSATDLSPLKGLRLRWLDLNETRVSNLNPLRGMPLAVLRIRNTPVSDLAPLAGMPLFELDCTSIPAADFSPLEECPLLTHLWLSHTGIDRLDFFRRCRLRELRFEFTPVGDLSPLKGMPLEVIRFYGAPVTDVAPLLSCPSLREIGLSSQAQNPALLRGLPNLARISNRGAAADPGEFVMGFWKSLNTASAPLHERSDPHP